MSPAAAQDVPADLLPRLRRSPIPVREPTAARRVYGGAPTPAVSRTQGTLALVLDDEPDPDDERLCAVTNEPPEPREWATTLLTASIEVAAGVRSPLQLVRWTSLEVQACLARRGALAARARRASAARSPSGFTRQPAGGGGRPQLRTIRLSSPCDGVYEVSAVVAEADRLRAVAMRMEGIEGRWRVTAMDIG